MYAGAVLTRFLRSEDFADRYRQTVRKPYDYIVSLGGKSFRREFLSALNVWLQVDMEACEVINEAVTMLHNSSLLYVI